MDFNIRSDTGQSRQAKRRPPNYSSRAVRIRLATLIALLGVSILAMHEASKPETWERMGFGSVPVVKNLTSDINLMSGINLNGPLILPDEVLDRFWKLHFQKLDIDEQKLLVQLVEDRVQQIKFRGDKQAAARLIEKTKNEFKKFRQSPNTPVDDIELEQYRTTIAELDFAPQDEPNDDSTSLPNLLRLLDETLYDMVEDRSALGRSVESLAWLRSWYRLDEFEPDDASAVTMVQLTGQPSAYRGEFIHIDGTVKGLERLKVASKELPLQHYHVLWIQPREMSRTPYCVYARELPPEFPPSTETFQNIDEQIAVKGIFFKLRSYVAKEGIETCPLIIADTFSWQPKTAGAFEATPTWQPPIWLLVLFFITMPLIAGWLALTVYRNTKVQPIVKKESELQTISDELNVIASDKSIMSDRERVEQLQRQLRDDEV